MDFTKKNNFKKIEWGIDTSNFKYKKLKDLYTVDKKSYIVRGFYVSNSGNYGKHAIAILDDCLVDLPKHKLEVIEELLNDKEAIDAIKNCECGFTVTKYTDKKFKKECYSFEFVNIEKIDIY